MSALEDSFNIRSGTGNAYALCDGYDKFIIAHTDPWWLVEYAQGHTPGRPILLHEMDKGIKQVGFCRSKQ